MSGFAGRLLAFALALPLGAQVVVATADATLRLDNLVRTHPEGMVLLIPGAQGPRLGAQLAEVLGQEPALPLQVPSQELDPGLPVAAELRRLAGWDAAQPRWACVDATGRIRFEGVGLPSAAAFAEAYRTSGLRSRRDLLEAFLADHPGHTEARAQLILLLRDVAEQRTERLLKARAPQAPKTLTDPEDEAVWEAYARRYAELMDDGAWLDAAPGGAGPVPLAAALSDQGAHSPRLQELGRRLLPGVEAQVRRAPTEGRRWKVWSSLRDAAGEGRPSQVMEGLESPPGLTVWPPEAALEAFADDAERTGDWRGVEALLQAWWDRNEAFLRELEAAVRKDARGTTVPKVHLGSAAGFAGWTGEVALLVEAKLRLHKTADAEALVRTVDARMPRKGIYRRAAEVARRCGEPLLAETWERTAEGR